MDCYLCNRELLEYELDEPYFVNECEICWECMNRFSAKDRYGLAETFEKLEIISDEGLSLIDRCENIIKKIRLVIA